MTELKTQPNDKDVVEYLNSIEDEKKRQDSLAILALMQGVTGEEPVMWGESIIGFGLYRYKCASGHAAEWFLTGFAPRKRNLTLYIMPGFELYDELLENLGKFKIGKSCLYINKLEDVDQDVLKELVKQSADHIAQTNALKANDAIIEGFTELPENYGVKYWADLMLILCREPADHFPVVITNHDIYNHQSGVVIAFMITNHP